MSELISKLVHFQNQHHSSWFIVIQHIDNVIQQTDNVSIPKVNITFTHNDIN